jgi:hypothetical protein
LSRAATLDEGFSCTYCSRISVHGAGAISICAWPSEQTAKTASLVRPNRSRVGLVIGISALVMTYRIATGGAKETAATKLFLFSLTKAFCIFGGAKLRCIAKG